MKLPLLLSSALLCSGLIAQVQVEPTGPMTDFRNGHAAAELSGNRALVCGGFNNSINLNSSEIFDLGTNEWEAGPPMLEVRYTHTANSLPNGRVLIAGGWDGGTVNHATTEIYDPIENEFVEGPTMAVGRSDHRATALSDGRVLITGGFTGSVNTDVCEIYDPTINGITEVASMNFGRSMHTATLLADGRVLVTGGFNPDYGFQMSQCEIYDPENDTWTITASLNVPRDNHGAVLMGNGQVMVIGGRYFDGINGNYGGLTSTEVFNVSDGLWGFGAPTFAGHSYIEPFGFNGASTIVLPGGTDISGIGFDLTFNLSELWTTDLEDWEDISLGTEGRFDYAMTRIGQSNVLVCGGNAGETGTAEVYTSTVISVEESTRSNDLQIYPNPAQQTLNVSSSSPIQSWRVLSMDGRTVITKALNGDLSVETIDLGQIPTGYYILELATKQGLIRRTFIRD